VKRAAVVLCTQKNPEGVEIEGAVFTGPTADEDAKKERRKLSIRGVAGGWFEIRTTNVKWRCYCGEYHGCTPGHCINRPA
jgi:hypothetical protein